MRAVTNPVGLTETTLTLPSHWVGYLINGDIEGMDPLDVQVAQECERMFGYCVGCSEEPEFCHAHDVIADGILPGDCLTYTFITNEGE